MLSAAAGCIAGGFGRALRILCGTLLLCGALSSGCSKPAPTASKFPTYKMRGTIVAVHVEDKSASIDADAIPGFMDAMTMEYTIHDATTLAKLKPKDKITADLIVGPDGAYVDNIKIEPAR
ncbi:MAG: copper-binding protein [Candidatus Acidiferrales bacterium]